jgi:hypothetical protein
MMSRRAWTFSIIAAIILYSVMFLIWWVNLPKPHFKHPAMTKQERQMVKKAIGKHGDWPVTREEISGIYYMTRDNERIRL